MPAGIGTTGGIINYSGLLYNTSDVSAPLVNSLPTRKVASVEFVVNSSFAMGDASQPEISETASMTAPAPSFVTREQKTNVVQIFQKTTGVSYLKQANTGALGGLNVAGQANNVANEFDFQVGVKTAEMRRDLEFSLLNGEYQKSTGDAVASKTKGLVNAIESNVLDAGAKELDPYILDELLRTMATDSPTANLNGLVLMCDAITRSQITNNWAKLPGFILPNSRTVSGIAITDLVTNYGTIGIMVHPMMKAKTALLVNFDVLSIAELDVPGKGNFFWEMLAKDGATEKGMIYGQAGLDFGPEWYHAKITNLSGTVTVPGTVTPEEPVNIK